MMQRSKVQNAQYVKVNDKLTEFISYFVKEFESKLLFYHRVLEGEIKKAGKFSNTFAGIVGQGVGGVLGVVAGLLLGSPAAGARGGSTIGKTLGESIGNKVGYEKYNEKLTRLADLIEYSQKDKSNFRKMIVEAGFDIFQSFEMQFIRVTTDQNEKDAIHRLAKDAVGRAINYMNSHDDLSISESVVFGTSKKESVYSTSPGYEIKYKCLLDKRTWRTGSLYQKAGIVIVDRNCTASYFRKKDNQNRTDKYGHRRPLKAENWERLNEKYEPDETFQFMDYQYMTNLKEFEKKSAEIFRIVNDEDAELTENRLKEVLEEVKCSILEEIEVLKLASHEKFIEDHELLLKIEEGLGNLQVEDYLRVFVDFFEDAKDERKEIIRIIQYSTNENVERFRNASKQREELSNVNISEHQRTRTKVESVNSGIHSLRENQEIIVSELRTLKGRKENEKHSIVFNMKGRLPAFTGRETELDSIHSLLQSEECPTLISQATSVTGLGGIGKSELAREYAYKYEEYYDHNVLWIDAETVNSLKTSFEELAEELKIPVVEKRDYGEEKRNIKHVVKDVYLHFRTSKCLFIFDNSERYTILKEYFPYSLDFGSNKPYIIITSRYRDWDIGQDGKISMVPVDTFPPEDAVEFIKKVLDSANQHEYDEINELAEKLQYFPLALKQAVAYINQQNKIAQKRGKETFRISNYLDDYQMQAEKLLNEGHYGETDRYAKTVLTTWITTLRIISGLQDSGKKAVNILNIMAYFSADKFDVKRYFAKEDENRLWNAVELLDQYSMNNLEHGMSSVHRLVQEVVRIGLVQENKEESVLNEALELIIGTHDITHIVSVWSFASKYKGLINNFYYNAEYGENKSTALHLLAESGDEKAVKYILEHSTNRNIDCLDVYGRTPSYRASANGHVKTLQLLVCNGADINSSRASGSSWLATGWTISHVAAYSGHSQIVKYLKDKGADMNAADSRGRTPLYIAIDEGKKDVVDVLDKSGESALSLAASTNNLELAKITLRNKTDEEKEILTNPKVVGKRGPLHLAANYGHFEIAKLLVENGANINISCNDGYTPFHMAASEGHRKIVEFFAEEVMKNSNGEFDILKVDDKSGWTVLHSTAKSGHIEILDFLINTFRQSRNISSFVNTVDIKGTTLMQTASYNNRLETVKYLVHKKANINAVDIYGTTPLFTAGIRNYHDIIKYILLEQNEQRAFTYCALENLLGLLDITPLHLAAVYDNLEMAEILVKRSRVNAGEKSSLTPLHAAAFFNSSKVIKCLLDNGAKTDTGINFSNVVYILNFVKPELEAVGYGFRFADQVIAYLKYIVKIPVIGKFISSQFTPTMISTAFGYDNPLVPKDDNEQPVHTIGSRIISFLLSLPRIENQLRIIKDYVSSKKSDGQLPSLGECSVLYDLANFKHQG